LLEKAERVLLDGGLLVFKAEILAGSAPDATFLDAGLLGQPGLAAQIDGLTGLTLEGGFDARLSPRSVDSVQRDENSGEQRGLLHRRDGRLSVPSLWFLRKREATSAIGWRRLQGWLMGRLLGDQLPRLRLGARGARDERGHIATIGAGPGRVFFGPYIALPEGRYEAAIAIDAPATVRPARLALDVVAGDRCLDSRVVQLVAGAATRVQLAFAVVSTRGEPLENVELRAWSEGGEATITECRLDAIAD
jgi:hypothetical protein